MKANAIKVVETDSKIEFAIGGMRTTLVKANVSPEVCEAGKWYGITVKIQRAAALPAGATDQAKFAAMERVATAFNAGTTNWNVRETAEEKLAREQAAARADLVEALGRLGYGEKAEAMILAFGQERGWTEAMTVTALSGQAEVSKKLIEIAQERKAERAGPAPAIDLAGLLAKVASA